MRTKRTQKIAPTTVSALVLLALAIPLAGARAAIEAADGRAMTGKEWYEYYLPRYLQRNARWRQIVSDPAKLKALAPKDGDKLEYLKRAVGIFSGYQGEFGSGFSPDSPFEGRANPAQLAQLKALVNDYRKWFEEEGKALMLRWLKGEKLTAEQQRYIPLLEVVLGLYECEMREGFWDKTFHMDFSHRGKPQKKLEDRPELERLVITRRQQIADKAIGIAVKGYRGEPMTADDLSVLASFLRHTHGCKGGHSGTAGRGQWYPNVASWSLGLKRYAPVAGKPLDADFDLYPLASLQRSPQYSDFLGRDPFILYEPELVILPLSYMRYYTSDQSSRGTTFRQPRPDAEPWLKDKSVRLSSLVGHGKPTVILGFDFLDPTMRGGWGQPQVLEHLIQAYGDKVNFMWIPSRVGFPGSSPGYLAPDCGEHSFVVPGGRSNGWGTLGFMTQVLPEETARIMKDIHLNLPHMTCPVYIQDSGYTWMNAMGIGGQVYAGVVITDRKGTLAWFNQTGNTSGYIIRPSKSFNCWPGHDYGRGPRPSE